MAELRNKYFQLEPMADDVFAAIIEPSSGCVGNAAVLDLGGRTLVWDTFQNHRAAALLREFATERFGNQPILVVNSHFHLDHCGGNQAFADSSILATAKTRELIMERNQTIVDGIHAQPEFLRQFAEQVEKETDPDRKREMTIQLGDYEEVWEAMKNFRLTPPNMTFERSMVLYGTKRTANLHCFGGGHTPSDLVLHLPVDEVLLIGDLITVGSHPMTRHGDAEEWLDMLDAIEQLPIRRIMAGHGPVVGKEHLQVIHSYLTELIGLAKDALAKDTPLEDLQRTVIPEAYASWRVPHLYTNNLKDLYTNFKSKVV